MQQARLLDRILAQCVIEHDWRHPLPGLRRIVAGRDLAGLAEAAEYHEVTGCVYHSLKGLPDVDTQALEVLEARYFQGLAAHLRTLGDLAHVRALLEPAGTSWLVVRGPVLPEVVYRRRDLRIYSDFDLVVSPDVLPQVLNLLRQGAAQPLGEPWPGSQQEVEGEILLELRYGTRIRLRRHLLGGSVGRGTLAISTGDILARARSVSLNGVQVATLDEADTLLHLAVMASMQRENRLGWLKDIEQSIASGLPEWDAVVERAHAWGAGDMVRAALERARAAAAAAVPGGVLRALSPVRPSGRLPAIASRAASSEAPSHGDLAGALLLRFLHVERQPWNPVEPGVWQEVLQLATQERVAPLLFEALPAPAEGGVPDTVRAILAQSHQEAARGAVAAYRQLADVLRALRFEELYPVLLKGAALARETYQDPARRPFSDLDMLVRIEDVDAINRILRELGYVIVGDAPSAADLAWRHGRGYYDPDGQRLPIDIHWRYSGYPNLYRFDYSGVFARARETAVDGERALIPSAADLVVASSVSFLRELWYGKPKLRYVRDVAEVIMRHAVDWGQVQRLVHEEPLIRSPLQLALGAAAQLLGAPMPHAVDDALKPRRWPAAARALGTHVCGSLLRRDHPREALLQVALMRWLDGSTLAGQARWAKGLVFVPRQLAASQRRWLRRL